MARGLIHVYTGEGKGKTTAAFGLAMRAAGHGKRVLVLQFLKSGIDNSGEVKAARKCGIKVIKFKDQTSPLFDPAVSVTVLKNSIKKAVSVAIDTISHSDYDLIIMEEFNNVLSNGYATLGDLKKILKSKPYGLEMVFTGRGAPDELIEKADYVTDMKMIKHPVNNGIKARKGIEF